MWRVVAALDRRVGETGGERVERRLPGGFLAYQAETENTRVVVLVDPDQLDPVAVGGADAADGPGADGADGFGPEGGNGGDGSDAGSTPADKPEDPALAKCLSRNDGLIPWHADPRVDIKDWNDRGAGPAHVHVHVHVQIMSAVDKRLGVADEGTRDRRLTGGLLNYRLDPLNSRLLVQIDPAVLDSAEFRSLVDRLAKKANADVRASRCVSTYTTAASPRGNSRRSATTSRTSCSTGTTSRSTTPRAAASSRTAARTSRCATRTASTARSFSASSGRPSRSSTATSPATGCSDGQPRASGNAHAIGH